MMNRGLRERLTEADILQIFVDIWEGVAALVPLSFIVTSKWRTFSNRLTHCLSSATLALHH